MLFTTSGIDPTCGDLGDILVRTTIPGIQCGSWDMQELGTHRPRPVARSHWRSARIPRRPRAGGALYAEAGGVWSHPPLGAGSSRPHVDPLTSLSSPRALRGCLDR